MTLSDNRNGSSSFILFNVLVGICILVRRNIDAKYTEVSTSVLNNLITDEILTSIDFKESMICISEFTFYFLTLMVLKSG